MSLTNRIWLDLYRLGSTLARRMPDGWAQRLPRLAGPVLATAMSGRRRMIERHLRRLHGDSATASEIRKEANAAFGSYVRYWMESFRLPDVPLSRLSSGIEVPDYHHVEAGLAAGNGVILALPHLGGWEWAGFWMAAVQDVPITVVVEPAEPPELFEWFVSFRRGLGMNVVALGADAGGEVMAALKRNEVVCLLCDRDIAGTGIEVEFIGERTTLPGGPALLALRSGAPVLPTGVYFEPGGGHLGLVRPPIDCTRRGKLRADIDRVTQDLADELELLIRRAPDQWHLLQPNWPSDLEWLALQA